MLSQSDITADSRWSSVQSQLSGLAAFSALKSQEDRLQLFEEYSGDLRVSSKLLSHACGTCVPALHLFVFAAYWQTPVFLCGAH